MHRAFFRSLALSTAAVASLTVCGPLQAEEWQVPAEKGALQQVLQQAQAGDILRLAPGKHEGPVVLDKPLTLSGAGKAGIAGNGTGSVVTINAPDSVVEGLELTGSGLSQETLDAGVKLSKTAHRAIVRDNRILDNLTGVDVHGARNATVSNNLIEGRQDLRMNERGNGIYVWNAPDLLAEYNTIRYGRDGIFVNTSPKDTFRNNRFEDLRFAVHYMHGNNGVIENNVSEGNDIGYALMFSDRLKVRNNVSIGDRNHGLMLNYANHAEISGNQVEGGGEKCLFMYNANKNTVTDNSFEGCPIGVHFTAGSANNAFKGNAFIANKTQVKYVGSRQLDWSTDGRGNYWSDHPAFDMNGDGIADTAYRPNDMVDQVLWTQPSAKLLVGSPAVQLLRWTQSQFPALLPGGIVDNAPLMHPPVRATPNSGVQG
ncbi:MULTISPECIES: nitrous oxide reductase family maturation protein NosD [Stappiaceae]|jgi:nitrous oxidase accessory protein|uniref:nitrous oxide reductase family maturation protein NosD n=1 Tax=Stappiaceae TaxID=2821832 RepID=UPI001ADD5358|nr:MULTISPECIES: nitrous oxide reductase family maturation protein NosD [Stappiaceae]MBO6856417.1 nitrous oxide reductase family maturation protein NosD [Roseibium sp.]MBO9462142.1 nitrous oxide reductase family maturation protein NosD [Labrenzia sp. R5_0]